MSTDQTNSAPPVPDPVEWSEGMLLHPHHFQQAWLRQDRLLHHHLSRIAPFHYGVSRIEIDRMALTAGRLRIVGLDAVMPDGLLVWSDGIVRERSSDKAEGKTKETRSVKHLEFDLRPHKEKLASPQRIYLSVPDQRPGSAKKDDDLARWRSDPGGEVVDENTADNALMIARLHPSLRLTLDFMVQPRSQVLPIAEIEFKNDVFQVTDYVPPTAGLTRDCPLSGECRKLVANLRGKAQYVAESAGGDANRAEARFTAMCLVAGLPPLEALLELQMVHPFDLYMALQGVAGHTSTLHASMMPPQTRAYDHLDPRNCIGGLVKTLQDMIDLVTQAFSTLTFEPTQDGFRIQVKPEWVTEDLVVGLRLKPGQKANDAEEWMKSAIISSESRKEEVVTHLRSGAARVVLSPDTMESYAASRDVVMYRIPAGEFIVAGEMLLIINPLDPNGVRRPADILMFLSAKAAAT